MEAVDLGGGRAVVVMKRGPVWGTADGGATWTEWSASPGTVGTNDRAQWALAGPEGRLYIGIFRNGQEDAFDVRTTVPVVAVAGEPSPPDASGARLSIEPNPASGVARVRLTLASPEAEVRVSVFDARGREVVVVARGPLASGEHSFALDTSPLAVGVYVVRPLVGSEVASGRFTVVR